MFYTDLIELRIDDYDAKWRLSPEALLKILETVSAHHVQQANDKIADKGMSWLLVEWQLQIIRMPSYGEKLKITTWVLNKNKAATSSRDFVVTDPAGRDCVYARVKFALVTIADGNINLISPQLIAAYDPEEKSVFAEEMPRLKEAEKYDAEKIIELRRDDIDFNGHVHNTRYLQFALESLPEDIYKQGRYKEMAIVYRKPIIPSQTPRVRIKRDGDKFCIAINVGETLCTLIEIVV